MSSPSPSNKPYKSRLFNFINRNYIKFNSQINVKFREFGYVAKTGLQTLVFPLFWLWETTKKISKTFSPVSSSVSSPLRDSPQSKTLASGDDLIKSVNEAINLNPQLISFPVKNFQGFASRLKDKHIICILENNKSTDLIPVNKQGEVKKLIDHIADELTNAQLLPCDSQSNFLSKFLAWFNIFDKSKMDVKISQDINNLNPSDLVLNNQSHSSLFLSKQNNIVSLIDNFFASLESLIFSGNLNISNADSPIANSKNQDNNIANCSQALNPENKEKLSIFLLIKAAIDYFLKRGSNHHNLTENSDNNNYKLPSFDENSSYFPLANSSTNNNIQNIVTRWQDSMEKIIFLVQDTNKKLISYGLNQLNIAKNNLNNKLNNPDDPFQVKILIWAAINYFFNKKNKANDLSSNHNKNSFLPSFSETEIIVINEEVADPWLSWEDLYGYAALSDSSINNNCLSFTDDREIITGTVEKTIKITPKSVIAHNKNDKIVERKSGSKSITIQEENPVKLEKETVVLEEIEAKVVEIKYEKHLLQIILEKLDQFILWLEEIIIKIVNKIKLLVKK